MSREFEKQPAAKYNGKEAAPASGASRQATSGGASGGREESPCMLLTLVVGAGVFVGSVVSFGMAIALFVHLMARLMRAGFTGLGFWKNVAVMIVVSLLTAATHLAQIALWAGVLVLLGEITTLEKAFYFSAQNYTALGYGDIVLSDRWRLLGPLEAINGLLLFGLSTGLMFAVLSHLIANRLRLHETSPGPVR